MLSYFKMSACCSVMALSNGLSVVPHFAFVKSKAFVHQPVDIADISKLVQDSSGANQMSAITEICKKL